MFAYEGDNKPVSLRKSDAFLHTTIDGHRRSLYLQVDELKKPENITRVISWTTPENGSTLPNAVAIDETEPRVWSHTELYEEDGSRYVISIPNYVIIAGEPVISIITYQQGTAILPVGYSHISGKGTFLSTNMPAEMNGYISQILSLYEQFYQLHAPDGLKVVTDKYIGRHLLNGKYSEVRDSWCFEQSQFLEKRYDRFDEEQLDCLKNVTNYTAQALKKAFDKEQPIALGDVERLLAQLDYAGIPIKREQYKSPFWRERIHPEINNDLDDTHYFWYAAWQMIPHSHIFGIPNPKRTELYVTLPTQADLEQLIPVHKRKIVVKALAIDLLMQVIHLQQIYNYRATGEWAVSQFCKGDPNPDLRIFSEEIIGFFVHDSLAYANEFGLYDYIKDSLWYKYTRGS